MHDGEVRVGGAARRARWLVSNGSKVVGPVSTDLLLRGIECGKVPPDCLIRDQAWTQWREAHQIREVRGWTRSQLGHEANPSELSDSGFSVAQGPEEVVLFALEAAMAALGAQVGIAHRVREPLFLPVTSCVLGLDPEDVLGQVIWQYDPAYATARQGRIVLETVGTSSASRAIAARMWRPEFQPVAVGMFPVLGRDGVIAMVELARTDHPFRAMDVKTLTRIAFAAAAQLAG
jgi:hypothetical protein